MKPIKNGGIIVFIQGSSLLKIAGGFLLFLFMIFSISGALTALKPEYRISSSFVNSATNKITGEMLYQFLGWENRHFLKGVNEQTSPPIMNSLFKLSTNINLNDPRSLLGKELPFFFFLIKELLLLVKGQTIRICRLNLPRQLSFYKQNKRQLLKILKI